MLFASGAIDFAVNERIDLIDKFFLAMRHGSLTLLPHFQTIH
jgi:hypothetical protein